jgi:hypothetical protein
MVAPCSLRAHQQYQQPTQILLWTPPLQQLQQQTHLLLMKAVVQLKYQNNQQQLWLG